MTESILLDAECTTWLMKKRHGLVDKSLRIFKLLPGKEGNGSAKFLKGSGSIHCLQVSSQTVNRSFMYSALKPMKQAFMGPSIT